LAAALGLALLGGSAAAQEAMDHGDSMMGMMTMRPGMEMSEADRGYMKSMQTMQQNMMKMEMTGDPSGDFARMMIPHHQSAIDMANVLLQQKDVDPEMKTMAEKMRDDQTKEIAELQKWLESHGK
jgi:uncharacterized protein (DUF305 family)